MPPNRIAPKRDATAPIAENNQQEAQVHVEAMIRGHLARAAEVPQVPPDQAQAAPTTEAGGVQKSHHYANAAGGLTGE